MTPEQESGQEAGQGGERVPPRRTASSGWRRLELTDLAGRLEAARDLLSQAAALAAAEEARTVCALTEQERRRGEEARHGHPRRRRYR